MDPSCCALARIAWGLLPEPMCARLAALDHEYDSTWKPVTVLGASDVTKVVDLRGFPVSPGGIGVVGEHIARYDPARVLREVAAKRAILARYEFARNQVAVGAVNEAAGYGPADAGWPLRMDSHELDVRNLASVYSGEPGYQAEWVP